RSPPRRSGTAARRAGRRAAGSATSSRCRTGRRPPACRRARAVDVAAPAGACLTWPAMRTPAPASRVSSAGRARGSGGPRAGARLWAGLIARLAQSLGHSLGLLQPALYAGAAAGQAAKGFRDITDGDNGAYSAGPGWDACTGLGVPDGTALLDVLRNSQPS